MSSRPHAPSSTLRRLQSGYLQHRARALDPAVGVTLPLIWDERAVVCTSPITFRVTVPVAGPAPTPGVVQRLVEEVRGVCAPPPAGGLWVRAAYGRAESLSPRRSQLTIFFTCVRPSEDPHRDAAYLAGIIRNAARRVSLGETT